MVCFQGENSKIPLLYCLFISFKKDLQNNPSKLFIFFLSLYDGHLQKHITLSLHKHLHLGICWSHWRRQIREVHRGIREGRSIRKATSGLPQVPKSFVGQLPPPQDAVRFWHLETFFEKCKFFRSGIRGGLRGSNRAGQAFEELLHFTHWAGSPTGGGASPPPKPKKLL